MVMKYCEDRHENRDDAKYCDTCGFPIAQNKGFTLAKFTIKAQFIFHENLS